MSGVSFTHVYDQAGSYNAVIEVMDGSGGISDCTTPVTVSAAPLTATFGPSGGGSYVTTSTPFVFTGVVDPSQAETAAGFTYYVSVDGGAFVPTSSPSSLPLAGLPDGTYTVSGYVANAEGAVSPTSTATVTLQDPQVVVSMPIGIAAQVAWAEGPAGGVELQGGQALYIDGPADGITVTLLQAGDYSLATNASFDGISGGGGSANVYTNLSVSTELDGPAHVWSSGSGSGSGSGYGSGYGLAAAGVAAAGATATARAAAAAAGIATAWSTPSARPRARPTRPTATATSARSTCPTSAR